MAELTLNAEIDTINGIVDAVDRIWNAQATLIFWD